MTVRILLHAPTTDALDRARSNARNVLVADPGAEIEIVVNAGAVVAALERADPQIDPLVRLCENSLRSQQLDNGGMLTVRVAILHIAQRQVEGWTYIRA